MKKNIGTCPSCRAIGVDIDTCWKTIGCKARFHRYLMGAAKGMAPVKHRTALIGAPGTEKAPTDIVYYFDINATKLHNETWAPKWMVAHYDRYVCKRKKFLTSDDYRSTACHGTTTAAEFWARKRKAA